MISEIKTAFIVHCSQVDSMPGSEWAFTETFTCIDFKILHKFTSFKFQNGTKQIVVQSY